MPNPYNHKISDSEPIIRFGGLPNRK